MADELGPIAVDADLIRLQLPDRLVELMLCYADVMRAAGPWLVGDVAVPLTQLKDLGAQLRGLEAATANVIAEAHRVYRETEAQRAAAQALLDGAQ